MQQSLSNWLGITKYFLIGIAVIAAVLAGAGFVYRGEIHRAIRVATGVVSHEICSGVFVSGLQADQIFAENIKPRPGLSLIAWGLAYTVDAEHRTVTATFQGGFANRAVFRYGLGCQVVHDLEPANAQPPAPEVAARPQLAALLPEIAGSAVVQTPDGKVCNAPCRAFPQAHNWRGPRTKTAGVVQERHVIAEGHRAADGPA